MMIRFDFLNSNENEDMDHGRRWLTQLIKTIKNINPNENQVQFILMIIKRRDDKLIVKQ